ncbi:TonB-dependent receptor [Caulobacter sp. Root655]|uniref:TonB-dependent siderophore receptor n=1 Tax=Caulobacter sp. Root655 TaxID=1736578 RepID=UPI0006FA2D7A|nr:TonB-dependent siderophore receptor [Caulobacter sp. Root655]KRA62382.1 TonB-dependent receptor [Caulobacter sp. Root655]
MDFRTALMAGCAAVGLSTNAAAEVDVEVADTVVENVTVTARRANASINGLDVSPLRLPQSVRVLDRQLIDQMGVANLSDLFDLAGGMARQNSFGGAWDAYAIRGFSGDINQGPDLLVNRFTANRGFNPRRDVATVEVFQVLKGPASALSGKGEPGGSINIVTKTPLRHAHASAELGYGDFDTWRAVGDVGGPMSGTVSARLVGAYQTTDGFRDHAGSDRLVLAPSLAWTPTDKTRLLYQFEAMDVHFVHDRGLVAVNGDGRALPRDRFLGEPNDGKIHQQSLQHQVSAAFDLVEGVSLEGGVQYRDGFFKGQSTHNASLVGAQLRRQLRVHDYDWQDFSGRAELSVRRQLVGLEHQLRVGGDAFTYDQRRVFLRYSPTAAAPYAIDVFNPVYGQAKPVATLNQDLLEELRGQSVYAQDLVTAGRFTVLLGLRHDWIQQTTTNYRSHTASHQSPARTSPRAALTWAASDQLSAYVSWGQSFRYNQGADAAGLAFAPEEGEALEGGAKYALRDGDLTGTLSVFRIDKKNILANDAANSGFFIAVGEARSQGVEFDANLKIGDQLTLTGVYAFTDTEITKDTRPDLVGSALSNIPRHSAAVHAHWRSAREGPGAIGVGGGLVYVGGRQGDDVNSGFTLPGYVTARLNLSYRVTPELSLHLDAENLLDAYYLESSYSNVWITPGAPRTITGRVKLAF